VVSVLRVDLETPAVILPKDWVLHFKYLTMYRHYGNQSEAKTCFCLRLSVLLAIRQPNWGQDLFLFAFISPTGTKQPNWGQDLFLIAFICPTADKCNYDKLRLRLFCIHHTGIMTIKVQPRLVFVCVYPSCYLSTVNPGLARYPECLLKDCRTGTFYHRIYALTLQNHQCHVA